MREQLESFMLVFGVGAAVAIGAKRVGIPYNVTLVVMGLVLVFADVLPHAPLDPEVVLVAFLPVLVLSAAVSPVLALHAGRAVAVYGCFAVLRAAGKDSVPARWQHVMVFGNIKGALSMAAVLALPADLPHRAELVAIVFGVTFVTLLTQALPFRRVLHLLGVALASDDAFDTARANLIAARRGQAELDSLLATGLLARGDHAERRAVFQRVIIDAEAALRTPEADAADDEVIEGAVLTAQKAALADAARRGLVASETAERAISAIDRRLLRRETDHVGAQADQPDQSARKEI